MRKTLSAHVKISVLSRAAPPCEICLQPTSFARFTEVGGKKVGRFAHIRAVSPGGPRYDPDYPVGRADSPENLFWSCTDCHDIVDKNEEWPLERLQSKLEETRASSGSTFELIIEGEISVSGEDVGDITGIDTRGRSTVFKPGTRIDVSGKRAGTVTGVKG